MIDDTPDTPKHRRLLEHAARNPGASYRAAGQALGWKGSEVRRHANSCRRIGWLRFGPVPRLVDVGLALMPDWRAADGVYPPYTEVYRRICSRYTLDLPCRRRDLIAGGTTDNQVHGALRRLRELGHVTETDTIWPTEVGQYLAAHRLGWDAPRESFYHNHTERGTAWDTAASRSSGISARTPRAGRPERAPLSNSASPSRPGSGSESAPPGTGRPCGASPARTR